MENLMGKSTAIFLILLAFGPNKGEPVSQTGEQLPPAAEKQVRSPLPAPTAGLKAHQEPLLAASAPESPPTAQLKQQESVDPSQVDLDEPPSVAIHRKNDGR
jgi:hypothetical protein